MERDVATDREAAREMARRSGQLRVPTFFVGEKVLVGFNQAELEKALREWTRE